MLANIAFEGTPVPDAPLKDQRRFQHLRDKAPDAVTDSEWKKIAYVLARGCRVEENQEAYEGNYLRHRYGKTTRFYDDKAGTYIDPITGEKWSGVPEYYPVRTADGKEITDKDYPFHLITWKDIMGGHSRTIADKWLDEIWPENYIWVNPRDAASLGLKTGDKARIVSATNDNGVVGKVKITGEIMPGVIGASWHKGHFNAYGARTLESYQLGSTQAVGSTGMLPEKADVELRSAGICPNPVMRVDPAYNVCLQDVIGGSSSFYDTKVKLVRA